MTPTVSRRSTVSRRPLRRWRRRWLGSRGGSEKGIARDLENSRFFKKIFFETFPIKLINFYSFDVKN